MMKSAWPPLVLHGEREHHGCAEQCAFQTCRGDLADWTECRFAEKAQVIHIQPRCRKLRRQRGQAAFIGQAAICGVQNETVETIDVSHVFQGFLTGHSGLSPPAPSSSKPHPSWKRRQ
jgi:hypothetical protein